MSRPRAPLNRGHYTRASRRTVPAYPLFCLVVGAVWTFDPGSRLVGTPALAFAGRWTPVMGGTLLILSVLLGYAFWRELRPLYMAALGALIGWMAVWAAVLLWAANAGAATWGAWAWPAMIGWLGWASLVTLDAEES